MQLVVVTKIWNGYLSYPFLDVIDGELLLVTLLKLSKYVL
jgi:hypothetical protein